ncbi:MAG TPA: type II toxin-antitoxin system VapC family toxin [Flavilitoribacter sp.]|nr:type II toxin-antitoxin system VapC family toxin [Flavilitoribacter sp.]HMQ87400.1 type II toxin-antitoxin system VapC family toxin [Flavilitoribacter sp.]
MTYLADTHVLVWAITDPEKLSPKVTGILESPDTHIMVSAVSFWEISMKYALGKLLLENIKPEDFPSLSAETGFESLPLSVEMYATYHQLNAAFHKDPFEKMLIWQAKCLKIPILSKDQKIRQYKSEGVSVIW